MAGVLELEALRRGGRLAASAALALALAGCGGPKKPQTLDDGSRPPVIPSALGHVRGRLVPGTVRTEVDPRRLASCLRDHGLRRAPRAVERTGVAGESLTFRQESYLYGCDSSGGRRCGIRAGLVRYGRLLDPRLDIVCEDAKGKDVGFAWIQPVPGARWIAIREPSYTELYEVAGGLPVRVTTSRVHVRTSSATFEVVQYAPDGAELSRSTVEAFVAG